MNGEKLSEIFYNDLRWQGGDDMERVRAAEEQEGARRMAPRL